MTGPTLCTPLGQHSTGKGESPDRLLMAVVFLSAWGAVGGCESARKKDADSAALLNWHRPPSLHPDVSISRSLCWGHSLSLALLCAPGAPRNGHQ